MPITYYLRCSFRLLFRFLTSRTPTGPDRLVVVLSILCRRRPRRRRSRGRSCSLNPRGPKRRPLVHQRSGRLGAVAEAVAEEDGRNGRDGIQTCGQHGSELRPNGTQVRLFSSYPTRFARWSGDDSVRPRWRRRWGRAAVAPSARGGRRRCCWCCSGRRRKRRKRRRRRRRRRTPRRWSQSCPGSAAGDGVRARQTFLAACSAERKGCTYRLVRQKPHFLIIILCHLSLLLGAAVRAVRVAPLESIDRVLARLCGSTSASSRSLSAQHHFLLLFPLFLLLLLVLLLLPVLLLLLSSRVHLLLRVVAAVRRREVHVHDERARRLGWHHSRGRGGRRGEQALALFGGNLLEALAARIWGGEIGGPGRDDWGGGGREGEGDVVDLVRLFQVPQDVTHSFE